jgi:hypothetical protein
VFAPLIDPERLVVPLAARARARAQHAGSLIQVWERRADARMADSRGDWPATPAGQGSSMPKSVVQPAVPSVPAAKSDRFHHPPPKA